MLVLFCTNNPNALTNAVPGCCPCGCGDVPLEHEVASTVRLGRQTCAVGGDGAIAGLLLGCGLRRSEVVELTLDQLQMRDGRWVIVDLSGKQDGYAPYRCGHGQSSFWTHGSGIRAGYGCSTAKYSDPPQQHADAAFAGSAHPLHRIRHCNEITDGGCHSLRG